MAAGLLTKTTHLTAWEDTAERDWITSVGGPPTADESFEALWTARTRTSEQARGDHGRGTHRRRWPQESEELRRQSVSTLLQEASTEFGMTWSNIARLVGVSVPALRKWRRDQNSAAGPNHAALAALVAFLRQLRLVGVDDPAGWLAMPFDPDYTVAPRDLYNGTNAPMLLDHAAGLIGVYQLLTNLVPDWRTRWERHYDVVVDDAGDQSLVRR